MLTREPKSHPSRATTLQLQALSAGVNMAAPLHSSKWAMCVGKSRAEPKHRGLTVQQEQLPNHRDPELLRRDELLRILNFYEIIK